MKVYGLVALIIILGACSNDSESEGKQLEVEKENYTELCDEGLALLEGFEPDQALEIFERAIKINSDSIRAYYGRAYCYTLFCDMDREAECSTAVQYWEEVASMDSCYRNTRYNLAMCYERMLEYETAITILTQALECKPNDPDIYFNRGISYMKLGDTLSYCLNMTNGYNLLGDKDTAYPLRRSAYEEICGDGWSKMGLDLQGGMGVILELADSVALGE